MNRGGAGGGGQVRGEGESINGENLVRPSEARVGFGLAREVRAIYVTEKRWPMKPTTTWQRLIASTARYFVVHGLLCPLGSDLEIFRFSNYMILKNISQI